MSGPEEQTPAPRDPALEPRRGGYAVALVWDLLRQTFSTRSWIVIVVLVLTAVAASVALAGQTALPWLIYPAL